MVSVKVNGYCPMGCGETLSASARVDEGLRCMAEGCPRPTAAAELLADPETEHVVNIARTGFSIIHPLRERLDGALHECDLHEYLTDLGGPPVEPGTYRAIYVGHDPVSSSLHAPLWHFEMTEWQVALVKDTTLPTPPGQGDA